MIATMIARMAAWIPDGMSAGTFRAATHQRPVGQLHWNSNLADIYANPGNVNGVRWCTGTLITESLFLSAGHCFDQNPPNGWMVPRVDGTNDPIPSSEIARNMHINFNYQIDPDGNDRVTTHRRV